MAATLTAFRTASLVARALPRPVLPTAARLGGKFATRSAADAAAMLQRHLVRVAPQLSSIELTTARRAGIDSYARYWIETLRLGGLDDATIDAGFRAEGYERHILGALEAGNGVILALPHLGGWEWAGRWLVQRGHRLTAVVERLEPPEVYEWFASLRRHVGINVVPHGPGSGREILAALGRNEVVALLCDRDLARSGVAVEFFGATTTLPAGPAVLSRRSGAPLLPTAVYFTDRSDGHVAIVRPPIERPAGRVSLRDEVASVTQSLATELETLIRRAPEQWHLLQPNWPDDPGYGPDPTRAEPAQSGPTKSGPTKSGPTKSGPTKSGPDQSGPDQSGPGHSGPDHSGRRDDQD